MSERLEDGWYWVRPKGVEVGYEPAWLFDSGALVSTRAGVMDAASLDIGHRITPPTEE